MSDGPASEPGVPRDPQPLSNKNGPSLGTRAARGAVVTLVGQSVRMVVQLGSVIILARLLSPRDYGLVAMVTAIVGIGEIFRDFGLSSAAIQARNLSRAQRDNLFWLNSGIGLLLSLIAFTIAGPLATLYGEPDLVPVAQTLAVTFLINGLATQFRADLSRRLRFARLAAVDIGGPVVGLLVALVLALNGAGYWALVAQQISVALVLLIGAAASAHWLPGAPRRGTDMGALLRFGWNLLGAQLIGYAGNNVDSLALGLRFGAGPLGLYNRAFQLLMTPLSQLRSPTTTVALPVLARLHDDPERFSEFVRRGQLALGYSLVAGLGAVVATADPLTDLLLGPQWSAVTPVIRLLALAGIFQTLAYVGYWVYLSRGLTGALLRYTLVEVAIKVACVVTGSAWGIEGAAAGYALAPALSWPLSLWWLSRKTRLPFGALFGGAARILAVVTTASGTGWLVVHAMDLQGEIVPLLATATVILATYALVALVVPAVRRDLKDVAVLGRLARNRDRPEQLSPPLP